MGYVYWVTGLSGAGKTTVGTKLYEYLREKKPNVIRMDGDILRNIFQCYDYTFDGRKALGFQYAKLCKMLSDQGIDVVICTVVMFDEVRQWNRENITDYREIYLEVELDELIRRDQKGLYSKATANKEENVCGVNMDVELPKFPDIKISNYGEITPDIAFQMIISHYHL